MPTQFQPREKVVRVLNATAAGTTDVNCTGVDTEGFDSVEFVGLFGALTATQVTALHAQYSDDNGSSDGWSDVAGTSTGPMGDDDDNDCLRLEISKPAKRYVRCVVDRATENAVVDGVIAILRGPSKADITEDATVIAATSLTAPAEGTA